MAEAVLRHLIEKRGLGDKIKVDSAGTGDWHIGHPPHQGTQTILHENKIKFDGIVARQVQEKDLEGFDYIIGMDVENIGNLHKMAGFKKTGTIARLLDFVSDADCQDVPDPYYTGNFEEVFTLVQKGCEGLLDTILREHEC